MTTIPLSRRLIIVTLALIAVSLNSQSVGAVSQSSDPQLLISQFKITSSSGQFITLQNNTDTNLDMTKFQLHYFNHYDIAKSTSNRFISLSGTLPARGYYMISDARVRLCYQLTVESASLGLSTTAGMIEVLSYAQSSPGGSIMPTLQDYVGWSKTPVANVQTLPTNTSAILQRSQNTSTGVGTWLAIQPDSADPCNFVTIATGSAPSSPITIGSGDLLPGLEPLATIINAISEPDSSSQLLSNANSGLMRPKITEILPNPAGSGTDATDEFIEIYNPNSQPFNLTGFSLRTGTTSLHSVRFPDGTNLPAQSFTTFYSRDLSTSLSNTAGQAALIDNLDQVIDQTEVYSAAKDGHSWALAKGIWYWTTTYTPNSANVINQPQLKSKNTKASVQKSAPKAKTTTTASPASGKQKEAIKSTTSFEDASSRAPVHANVLALIACLALLYGAYEYRADLGNRIHKFRKYFATRREHRV